MAESADPNQKPSSNNVDPATALLLWREIDEQDRKTIVGIKKDAKRFGRDHLEDKVKVICFLGLSGLLNSDTPDSGSSNHNIQRDLAQSCLKETHKILKGINIDIGPGAVACYAHPERLNADNYNSYVDAVAGRYFLPKVAYKTEDGQWRKRGAEEARKNMRITLIDHSFGAVQVAEVRRLLREKMKEIGFDDKEIGRIFQNVLEISLAPTAVCDLTPDDEFYKDSPPYFNQMMFYAQPDDCKEFFLNIVEKENRKISEGQRGNKRPLFILNGDQGKTKAHAHSADCIYHNMPKSLKKLLAFGVKAESLPENYGQWSVQVHGPAAPGPRIVESIPLYFLTIYSWAISCYTGSMMFIHCKGK